MSHFNLFSCHKFLEQSGARLLAILARSDASDMGAIENIHILLSEFSERLKGHSNWEEHFIFKLLPSETIDHEQDFHNHLNDEIDSIHQELRAIENVENQNLHPVYLHFRKFYSELLSHLYDEEVNIIKLLYERFSEYELRQIDHDIYKSMSTNDMVSMVNELFPPCNFGEKLAILEDLKSANPHALNTAWPDITSLFSKEEKNKLLMHFKMAMKA